MRTQTKLYFIVPILAVFLLSCTRIPENQSLARGDVVIEKLPQANSIPIEWGKLVSATMQPGSQNWTQLWFQDEKGDIRVVLFSVRLNRLDVVARLIPRK